MKLQDDTRKDRDVKIKACVSNENKMVYELYGCDFDSCKEKEEEEVLRVLFSLFWGKMEYTRKRQQQATRKNTHNKMKILRG